MDVDAADSKESSLPGPSNNLDHATAGRQKTDETRRQPETARTEDDDAETETPLQPVRALGKLRFRPADDNEPQ